MDLLTLLGAIPAVAPYVGAIGAAGYAVALVATKLAPPTAPGAYASFYRVVNFVGANFGHAANATAPATH